MTWQTRLFCFCFTVPSSTNAPEGRHCWVGDGGGEFVGVVSRSRLLFSCPFCVTTTHDYFASRVKTLPRVCFSSSLLYTTTKSCHWRCCAVPTSRQQKPHALGFNMYLLLLQLDRVYMLVLLQRIMTAHINTHITIYNYYYIYIYIYIVPSFFFRAVSW